MPLDWLNILSLILLAGTGCGFIYLGAAAIAVRRFVHRPPPRNLSRRPVSVLKPLCGEDPGLYDNLRSFCRQDHPTVQLVFGVRDADDRAIPVVRRLMAEYPEADLALVVDARRRGSNRKVANLQNMLPAARHDVLVLADSDMRVEPQYIAEVTADLENPEGNLVTCLYRGVSAGGFWSDLAASHINHGFLPQVLVSRACGVTTGCFGSTIALGRQTLDEIGGLAAIKDELADDHALGAAVRRLGRQIVLSPHLVDNVLVESSLAAMFRHELRWARTIRGLAPAGFFVSVITQPVMLAALAAMTGERTALSLGLFVAALVWRCATVRDLDRTLRLTPTPLWRVPVRDVLSFSVFVASFFTRTVAWRNSTFRVGPNGQLILDGDSPA
jgi:ceramide glucosyltransferase